MRKAKHLLAAALALLFVVGCGQPAEAFASHLRIVARLTPVRATILL